MAQHDFNIANATFPAVRTDINNALSAINSMQSGTSRPASAVAGTMWLDTTNATNPTIKFFDGTDDIQFATVNYSANTIDFLDSSLSTPITVTGSSSAGAELRLPEDTDNGTNYIALKAPDTIASNLTLTLPATDGASGEALVTNGSGVLSFASVGLAWQSVVTASTLTAVAGRGYFIDTTSNACTVTLPSSPTNGDTIAIVDYAGTSATNKITLNGNGNKINGSTVNKTIQTNRQAITLTYSDVTTGWLLSSASLEGTLGLVGVPAPPTIGTATGTSFSTATVEFTAPSDNGGSTITTYTATSNPDNITGTLSQAGSGTITVSGLTPNTSYTFTVTATNSIGTSSASSASNSTTTLNSYSIDFLVIAGGGGGGGHVGGGGGAGGHRTSTQTADIGTVITVTVGDGGVGATTNALRGTSGSNSSISGSGLTTITSAGGGGGGTLSGTQAGISGGSGGGGNTAGAGGSGNTPNTSPSQGNNGGNGSPQNAPAGLYPAGGGGGAGGVGANATAPASANGGNGTANSITGSSVTRAGGGGGGGNNNPRGLGGTGGGGDGANTVGSILGTEGTVNTGSGGGGGSNTTGSPQVAKAGGKGVVILSVPTAIYSSTTTGSPTVTPSGSNTIMQFNGSGSYTA
jgi:hypothetical protein